MADLTSIYFTCKCVIFIESQRLRMAVGGKKKKSNSMLSTRNSLYTQRHKQAEKNGNIFYAISNLNKAEVSVLI